MSRNLRSHEGYFVMDHRASPGVPDQVIVAAGLPVGAGRGVFEAPTFTCKHCQTVVIMNPDRKRERAYCRGCDHLICDACGSVRAQSGECKTFDRVIDEMLNAAERAGKQ